MPYLAVNGLSPSVAMDAEETIEEVGATAMAFDGTPNRTRQRLKRHLSFSTTPMTSTNARAWSGLYLGEGEHWDFNGSFYGSKGLGYSANTGCTTTASSGKFSEGRLTIPMTTGTITFATGLSAAAGWTVMYWHDRGALGTYVHRTILSDGTFYLNGASNAGTGWDAFHNVTGGSLSLVNDTGSNDYVSDLTVLPFKIPTTWPATLGVAAVSFSDLPRLKVTGDILEETSGTRNCLGSVTTLKPLRGAISGTNAATHRVLSVTLSEV